MASTRSRRAVVGVAIAVAVLAAVAVAARDAGKGPAEPTGEVAQGVRPSDDLPEEGEGPFAEHAPQGGAADGALPSDAGRDVEQEGNATGERWESRRAEGDASQAASEVLRRYKAEGDCVLCRAGYVDLFQNVWSCVVQGPGWVDLCVVSQAGDSSGCEVKTLRMEAGEWGKELGGQ